MDWLDLKKNNQRRWWGIQVFLILCLLVSRRWGYTLTAKNTLWCSNHCTTTCYFNSWLSTMVLWSQLLIPVLIIHFLMKHLMPSFQSLTVNNIYSGEGADSSGVPTKMLTLNSSLRIGVYNPATFFGIHVSSTPINLIYSEIPIATGQVIFLPMFHIVVNKT